MPVSKKDLSLYSSVSAHPPDLVGSWVNELGSTMKIDSVVNGLISGSYSSKVSEGEDPVTGDLTGYVAGDTIGFTVSWETDPPSVTAWAGKLLATPTGTAYIYTLWYLSRAVDDPKDWWESFLAGSDTFWKSA